MYKTYGKLLAATRKNVGYSQEAVAEKFYISVGSIRKYENGEYLPPEDIVAQMIILYDSPRVGYEWLRQNSVGTMLLPELVEKSLYEICSDLYRGIKDAIRLERRLGNIVADNKIDRNEIITHQRGQAVIKRIIQAAFSFLVHEKTTPARVAR